MVRDRVRIVRVVRVVRVERVVRVVREVRVLEAGGQEEATKMSSG